MENIGFAEKAPYRHKIKSVDELRQIIGSPPREQKVIMCHGTFDIVHPGHLRHLIYAKEHADILIASITCDAHIKKANLRPYVPEDLRALNLAAFEFVDYVVVDRDPTPLKNLAALKPDYFAKGFEYVRGGMHPKTEEENEVLESYGGEILFTPGDIVYSSSAIIEAEPPELGIEKLLVLMQGEKFNFNDLRHALEQVRGIKVHVLGDTIVDSLTKGSMIGGMTKTPTASVRYENRTDFVGGAGIVAKHLKAAGADVTFSTVLGEDDLKEFVLADLEEAGVTTRAIIDPTRPTTNKNAIVAAGYRLLKIDTLDNRSISEKILEEFCSEISASDADIFVFSDFRHGIFNRDNIPQLTASIPDGAFRVADSQVASRWGNICEFQGFDIITPNEREARFALGDQDSVMRPLASRLYEAAECKTLMLKLGDRGMLTQFAAESSDRSFFYVIDSFVDNVVDAVGAGDALLAYSALTLKATGSHAIASIMGSIAAAIECEYDGNIPVDPVAINKKIKLVEKMAGVS
jgi:rfaE bifunctional protein kinase chain/domain